MSRVRRAASALTLSPPQPWRVAVAPLEPESPLSLSFHFTTRCSMWDPAPSLTPFMCWPVGGGGEEAQSLLGFQLGGASEPKLLRQL